MRKLGRNFLQENPGKGNLLQAGIVTSTGRGTLGSPVEGKRIFPRKFSWRREFSPSWRRSNHQEPNFGISRGPQEFPCSLSTIRELLNPIPQHRHQLPAGIFFWDIQTFFSHNIPKSRKSSGPKESIPNFQDIPKIFGTTSCWQLP